MQTVTKNLQSFGVPLFSGTTYENNPNLKVERTRSFEIGLETSLFNKRTGFDLSYYETRSIDQILNLPTSASSGALSKLVNAGRMDNKGVELAIFGSPIRNNDFEWRINGTWAKNTNEVIAITEDSNTFQLASVQGGITINATEGQPFGTIVGTNFTYLNGERVIDETSGRYVVDSEKQVLGNINPDWKAGINNMIRYKNLSFNFLVDIQKGGDVFSLDTWYGYATGIYAESAGLNELGNPKRDPVASGGGILLEGLNPDGTINTTRTEMNFFNALGYTTAPNALHVYDASYVKLREMSLSYKLPTRMLSKLPFSDITFTATGRNLWILHKNTPHTDPEAGLSAGNIQGYQSGAHPSQKEYGFNIRFQF